MRGRRGLIVPISRGDFDESHVYAELGDILIGIEEGRTNDSQFTFFKSVVNAIQDLVVASFLEERARQEGLDTEVALKQKAEGFALDVFRISRNYIIR